MWSCEDHIYSLTSIRQTSMNDKESVFAAFIDLEKAFDWVDRDLLMYRLLQYNIDGRMYHAIRSLYRRTESCVRLNNSLLSEWFLVENGVRQGDSLSPTLFSLYINELAKSINNLNLGIKVGNSKVSILLYADDMVLIAKSEKDLQKMLDCMNLWCKQWRLKINTSKSNIVHFRPKRHKLTTYEFCLGDQKLETVSEYKYLGVILDEHLTFTQCSKTLADAGGRALSAIISKFKQFKDFGFETFSKMYETGVIPVVDYGSGIWGFTKNKHSDIIQNKAARYFLGVHNFTPIPALQGETGWLPCTYRKSINMIRYWNRLMKMSNDKLTKYIFNCNYNSTSIYPNWINAVKDIFQSIKMDDVFANRCVCDIDICKSELWKIAQEDWKIFVNSKPKLRTYIKFKDKLETTDYVKDVLSKYDRSLLAKFRCGILQLHIESGRFNQTKLEDRICKICDHNFIEDEFHFLCICPAYDQERQNLFTFIKIKYPEFENLNVEDKFIFLLSTCNRYIVKYLKLAWEKRKGTLFK